jgi:Domain of unknown function (DUF4159)
MRARRLAWFALIALALTASVTLGQQWLGGRGSYDPASGDRAGVPDWETDPSFPKDVFTFVRVQYDSSRGGGGFGGMGFPGGFGGGGGRRRGGGGRWGGGWLTDFPDSDLNFSYRLQQLTSLKVNPDPISRRVTDEDLSDYPFLYMIEPGALYFSEEEVVALRRYLLNGGFLMVDDFWGDYQWENFYQQIKRVFPDREPHELPIEHEIFRCVYRLREKPQVPSIHTWEGSGRSITYEPYHGGNTEEVHYRGIFDDQNRMMMIICHNTDLGDGWEREGEDPSYFHEFSEKKSYPMGINIVTYAMTH